MAAPGANLKIDGAWLWDSLMEMAKIGPGVAGGNNRQTLTDARSGSAQGASSRQASDLWPSAAGEVQAASGGAAAMTLLHLHLE
jgi:N-carbamoyl-L-amino-acid hydrolase